jgi:hypothetical protein
VSRTRAFSALATLSAGEIGVTSLDELAAAIDRGD